MKRNPLVRSIDPFPNDTREKRRYKVRRNRSLYLAEGKTYPGGSEVLLPIELAELRYRHVLEQNEKVEELPAEVSGAHNRGVSPRKRVIPNQDKE